MNAANPMNETGVSAAVAVSGDDRGAAIAKTQGESARLWSGVCLAGAECSGPSIVQMTNGEASALEIAAGIQPAGRIARRTIARRASCKAVDLRAVLTEAFSRKGAAASTRRGALEDGLKALGLRYGIPTARSQVIFRAMGVHG
jgi:hypothetical protein